MAGTHAVFKDGVAYADDCEDALRGAHAALLVTAWPEFKKISPQKFRKLLKRPVLIDGRRMYDPEKYGRHLRYIAVGRGA
jgi:UDP-glucose 6-dehydrogenase